MTQLTEPPSEAVPVKQAGEPPTSNDHGGSNSAFAARNPFLDRWLHAIASDGSLPPEAREVANVMACSVGIGRVAFTNWQRINTALGCNRTDYGVFESIKQLQSAGYLGRFQGNRYDKSRGWSLMVPEGEL